MSLDIGIDLDGVCYDFTSSLRHYLVEHEGYDPVAIAGGGHDDPDATWSFFEDNWGLSLDQFLDFCNKGVDAGVVFCKGEPFVDTVESLNALKDAGHYLHVVTSRSFGTKSHHNTADWLYEHDIPFDSLIFTPHKHVFSGLDLMVDDYEKNWRGMWEEGVTTYLYTRPWNQHVETGFRVDSWQEFLEVVENYESVEVPEAN